MGGSDSKYADLEVSELKEPLCVFDRRFVAPARHPTYLHMKAKFFSLSCDSFKVVDPSTNQEWFSVKGKALSLSDKRTLFDTQGQPVFVMKEKVLQLNDKQTVYRGSDPSEEMFKVASNFGNTKQWATVKDDLGKEHRIVMKMTWMGFKGAIWLGEPKEGGICIAIVKSPLQWQNFAGSWARDDFIVRIAPGVDAALIVAMLCAYDEMEDTYDDGN